MEKNITVREAHVIKKKMEDIFASYIRDAEERTGLEIGSLYMHRMKRADGKNVLTGIQVDMGMPEVLDES